MVAIAQLVELSSVARAVTGSSPVGHPRGSNDIRLGYTYFMKKIVFKHKKFSVQTEDVILPDGHKINFASVIKQDGTAIIALLDKDTILLNRQYRVPVKKWIYELPGGKIEKGETPRGNAVKELEEETGYLAKNIKLVAKIHPAPYICNDFQYLFLCTDLIKTRQQLEKGEVIKLKKVKIEDALKMVQKGKIVDAVTMLAILMIRDSKL